MKEVSKGGLVFLLKQFRVFKLTSRPNIRNLNHRSSSSLPLRAGWNTVFSSVIMGDQPDVVCTEHSIGAHVA